MPTSRSRTGTRSLGPSACISPRRWPASAWPSAPVWTCTGGLSPLVYAADRPGRARLTRLLTTGRRRTAKGGCRLGADDLVPDTGGLIAVALDAEPEWLGALREAFPARLYIALRHPADGVAARDAPHAERRPRVRDAPTCRKGTPVQQKDGLRMRNTGYAARPIPHIDRYARTARPAATPTDHPQTLCRVPDITPHSSNHISMPVKTQ